MIIIFIKDAVENLLKLVKDELEKVKETKKQQNNNEKNDSTEADNSNYAYKELYELTQRRFLRQLNQFSEKMSTIKANPVLYCIDLVDRQLINKERSGKISNDENTVELVPCLKPMCEYEEGWHLSETFTVLPELNTSFCLYLARIMSLLKNGSVSTTMQVFLCEQGKKLLDDIEKVNSNSTSADIKESYISVRKHFVNEREEKNLKLDLKRCELKNGKIMWLCKEHAQITNSKIINDSLATIVSNKSEQSQIKFLEDIQQVKIELVDEQCNL